MTIGKDNPNYELKPSQEILDYIKEKENLELKSYLDAAGIWTIGYGHVCLKDEPFFPFGKKKKITKAEADAIFNIDIDRVSVNPIKRLVRVPLTQGQFDALVSFVFNIGEGNFAKSTMLKRINAERFDDAVTEFTKWVYSDGVILSGLQTRRNEEKNIFLT